MLTPSHRNTDNSDTGPSSAVPSDDRASWVNRPAQSLGQLIHQRIRRRLNDRVRDLEVQVTGKRIVLRGRCATYYSKQLAQHAALGAIEDERLENAIEVRIAN